MILFYYIGQITIFILVWIALWLIALKSAGHTFPVVFESEGQKLVSFAILPLVLILRLLLRIFGVIIISVTGLFVVVKKKENSQP